MYYYKNVINGEIVSVESRNLAAVNPPETMQEITQEEHDALMAQYAVEEDQPSIEERMTAVEEAVDILLNGTTEPPAEGMEADNGDA